MKQANAVTRVRRHRSVASDANWQEWISESAVARSAPPWSASPVVSGDVDMDLSQETIARVAFANWQARGCPHGSPEVDWLLAEQMLRSRTRH